MINLTGIKLRQFFLGLGVGLVIFVSGALLVARLYSHPGSVARKIVEADSITVTNLFHEAFSIVITGDDVGKIVRAIGTANRTSPFAKYECTPSLRLQFYKGTIFLAAVDTCGKLIWTGEAEYLDQTGALQVLEVEYFQQRRQRLANQSNTP